MHIIPTLYCCMKFAFGYIFLKKISFTMVIAQDGYEKSLDIYANHRCLISQNDPFNSSCVPNSQLYKKHELHLFASQIILKFWYFYIQTLCPHNFSWYSGLSNLIWRIRGTNMTHWWDVMIVLVIHLD